MEGLRNYVYVMFAIFLAFALFFSLQITHDILKKVDTNDKVLYLTFDDDPGPYTKQTLNFLDDKQVPATFFVIGERAKENPDIVRRMIEDGHVVGTHSNTHPYLFFNVKEELLLGKLSAEYSSGSTVTLFRAPYGFVMPWTYFAAKDLDLKVVQWSCFPRDYTDPSPEEISRRVINCFSPGAIIVLHSANHENTVKALPEIVSQARMQGYTFKSLE